ncbi:Protein CBG16780 [Caenorhabditis briggsae]|uniref:Uncharacterized protein n=2 Tax=Caenorhabditis briggsae TaxID=6238 RepID=A0AAE8ZRF2_CAEBR|nr:Protein CBG16780 [Caenorhabditis briggsae]ULT83233.1 hypothetical protein L3Y34_012465 [Caenorhabditis briggsae]CAP34655.2 Protein CBG16780 [Caenorhabditis briggsae]
MESSSSPRTSSVLPNKKSNMNHDGKARPTGAPPPLPAASSLPTSSPLPSSSIPSPPGPPPPSLAKPSEDPLKCLKARKKGRTSSCVGNSNSGSAQDNLLMELQERFKGRRKLSTTDEEEEQDDEKAGRSKQEEVSQSGHLDPEVSPQLPTIEVVPGTIPTPPPPPPPQDLLKTQKIPVLMSYRLSTPVTFLSSKASSSQADVMAELKEKMAKRKSMAQESPSCSSTSTSAPNGSSTSPISDPTSQRVYKRTAVAKLQLPPVPSPSTKPKLISSDSSEKKEVDKHPEQTVKARDSKFHTVPAERNRRLTMPLLASHSTNTEKLVKKTNEEEGKSVPTQRSFKDTLVMWNNKAEKTKPFDQSRFSLVLNRRETSRRPDSTARTTTGEQGKTAKEAVTTRNES